MSVELSNSVVLSGSLSVGGLFLKKWEPPIKKQYVALSLLAIGLILGHFMVNYAAYGFLMAGLTGILIVVGLFLKKWEPPIKKQYVALSLLAIGLILGHLMVNYAAYGFLMAGLVFYKDELVEEVKLVKESVIAVKKEKDLTNGEDK